MPTAVPSCVSRIASAIIHGWCPCLRLMCPVNSVMSGELCHEDDCCFKLSCCLNACPGPRSYPCNVSWFVGYPIMQSRSNHGHGPEHQIAIKTKSLNQIYFHDFQCKLTCVVENRLTNWDAQSMPYLHGKSHRCFNENKLQFCWQCYLRLATPRVFVDVTAGFAVWLYQQRHQYSDVGLL